MPAAPAPMTTTSKPRESEDRPLAPLSDEGRIDTGKEANPRPKAMRPQAKEGRPHRPFATCLQRAGPSGTVTARPARANRRGSTDRTDARCRRSTTHWRDHATPNVLRDARSCERAQDHGRSPARAHRGATH